MKERARVAEVAAAAKATQTATHFACGAEPRQIRNLGFFAYVR